MHKSSMNRKIVTRLITIAAWVAVIAIAYATLTHVGFVYAIYFKLAPLLMGPEMRTYAHFEHVLAFALLGALFAYAYPTSCCWFVVWCSAAPSFSNLRRP